MPHSKCVACKTRLSSAGGPPEPAGERCPGCGALLEPVGSLAEVVGFQWITRREDPTAGAVAQAVALQRPDLRG